MVENGTGCSFPVVFFDGQSEIDIGDVVVHPSLEFKSFQAILSQKIGISPHQISVYLDCRKKSRSSPERRRRIPITGKANFAAILYQKDSFFLVVLKRSRRERRRKPTRGNNTQDEDLCASAEAQQNKASPPEKMILLRRGQNSPFPGFLTPYYDQIVPYDYSDLRIQREKYLRAMNSDSESYSRTTTDPVACECCIAKEEGETVPFHWCVHDAVTFGFRSPAGPIARPVKSSN